MSTVSTKRITNLIRAHLRTRHDQAAGEQAIISAVRIQDRTISPKDIAAELREMRRREELYTEGPVERRRYKLPPEPERLPDETPRQVGEIEYTPPIDPPAPDPAPAEAAPTRIAQVRALLAERGPLHVTAIGEALGLAAEATRDSLRRQLDMEARLGRLLRESGTYGLPGQEMPVKPTPTPTPPPAATAAGLDDLALQIAMHAQGLLAAALKERDGRITLLQAEIESQRGLADRTQRAETRVAELERALAATGDALTKAEDEARKARAEVEEIRALGRKLFGGQ